MLTDFRVISTVSRHTETATILVFQGFYEPVGLKYRLLNALFLRRVLRRRSLAVMKGIKCIAEGKGTPDGHLNQQSGRREVSLLNDPATRSSQCERGSTGQEPHTILL
jgi:hypothetical protein